MSFGYAGSVGLYTLEEKSGPVSGESSGISKSIFIRC